MNAFSAPPLLETSRLLLRAHGPEDWPLSAAMRQDPRVYEGISGAPATPEESWRRLLAYAGHWLWRGFGYWAIEEKASGAYLGEVGFADYRREMTPSLDGAPEAGWALRAEFHGRGFALEAASAAVAWMDETLQAPRTACIISPDNTASLRMAQKLGFREVTQTTYKGGPIIVFERARPS